jgi:hypothetical protein
MQINYTYLSKTLINLKMKKSNFSKTLRFDKETIGKLQNGEMLSLRGGGLLDATDASCACTGISECHTQCHLTHEVACQNIK